MGRGRGVVVVGGVSKIFGFLIFLAKKDTEGYGKFFPFQWPIKA